MNVLRLTLLAAIAVSGVSDGTTYYIGALGDDGADGLSPDSAWATAAPLDQVTLSGGDRILFSGSVHLPRGIVIEGFRSGGESLPLLVGTHGEEPATVRVATGDGIRVLDSAHVWIRDLVLEGPGRSNSLGGHGILVQAGAEDGTRYPGVRIDGVEVRDFYWDGIMVAAIHASNSGFDGLTIQNCTIVENGLNGIEFTALFRMGPEAHYAHRDIRISDCYVSDNSGRPDFPVGSGNGITVGFVSGGVIENCVVSRNGEFNEAAGRGPAGISVRESDRITIQRCESFANDTKSEDGIGILLDGGTTNSVVQHCFVHDNRGAGLAVLQFPFARPNARNVIRYNISQGNGTLSGGGIEVGSAIPSAGTTDLLICHNAVYAGTIQNGAAFQYRIDEREADGNAGVRDMRVCNNVFLTSYGKDIVSVPESDPSWSFRGNAYYTYGEAYVIRWAGKAYTSLTTWRAESGMERGTGIDSDPLLRAPGAARTVGNPAELPEMTAYLPLPESPLIDSATDVSAGSNKALFDFAGKSIPQGGAADIGPLEYLDTLPSNCFAQRRASLQFDTFANVLGGGPPGFMFHYPGYFDYDSASPGAPRAQDGDLNGIYDAYEFALLAAALCDDASVREHYDAALRFHDAIWKVNGVDYSYGATPGLAAMDTMSTSARTILEWTSGTRYGPYTLEPGAEPLSAEGDFDGDGLSNLEEFQAVVAKDGTAEDYAKAASTPAPR